MRLGGLWEGSGWLLWEGSGKSAARLWRFWWLWRCQQFLGGSAFIKWHHSAKACIFVIFKCLFKYVSPIPQLSHLSGFPARIPVWQAYCEGPYRHITLHNPTSSSCLEITYVSRLPAIRCNIFSRSLICEFRLGG